MIKFFYNEEFRRIDLPHGALRKNYAISNYGRVVSYDKELKDGRLLQCGTIQGYIALKLSPKLPYKHSKTFFVHKLVAEYFLPRPSDEHTFVLHRDFSKTNNKSTNLFWATQPEKKAHFNKNPKIIENRQKLQESPRQSGHKLNTTEVMRIKKKIFDPERKTRMKLIAKQFKISEMQLYRIRSGENWSHVKVNVLGKPIGVASEFDALIKEK